MMSCELQLLHQIRSVLTYSAKTIFHRGQYSECIQDPALTYHLLQLGSAGKDTGIFLGLCLPKQCKDTLITSYINSALKTLNLPFSVLQMSSGVYSYSFDWLSYLTIAILATIGILSVLGTAKGAGKPKKDNRKSSFLGCFDLLSNATTLFEKKKEHLLIWDGVRALAMMWVVIGHSLSFWTTQVDNIASILDFGNHPVFLVVGAGILSVDTFLALGGFFLAYIFLKSNKPGSLVTILLSILQRALRLWPAYLVAMLLFFSVYMGLDSGPFWYQMQYQTQLCSKMWKEVLFLANFVDNGSGGCLSWGWYLQVDFQLFILGLLLLTCYSWRKKIFYSLLILLAVGSSVYTFLYTQLNDITIFLDLTSSSNYVEYMHDVYIKPYGRCLPYFMGLLFGILFSQHAHHQPNQQEETPFITRLSSRLSTNCWLRRAVEGTGVLLMAFVVFIPRTLQTGHKWPQTLHSLYWLFSKVLFIMGLFLAVLPGLLGTQSLIRVMLSSKVLRFLSRISFCSYLVHLMVIYGFIYDRPYDVYFSVLDSFVVYLGLLVLSLALGLILTLTVEVPFANLLKAGAKRQKEEEKGQSLISSAGSEEITDDKERMHP